MGDYIQDYRKVISAKLVFFVNLNSNIRGNSPWTIPQLNLDYSAMVLEGFQTHLRHCGRTALDMITTMIITTATLTTLVVRRI